MHDSERDGERRRERGDRAAQGCARSGIPYSNLTLKLLIANPRNNLTPNGVVGTFAVAYSSTGSSGAFTTYLSVPPPTTTPYQQVSIPLTAKNLGMVVVLVSAVAFNSQTSGQCVAQIHDCWLEGIA